MCISYYTHFSPYSVDCIIKNPGTDECRIIFEISGLIKELALKKKERRLVSSNVRWTYLMNSDHAHEYSTNNKLLRRRNGCMTRSIRIYHVCEYYDILHYVRVEHALVSQKPNAVVTECFH